MFHVHWDLWNDVVLTTNILNHHIGDTEIILTNVHVDLECNTQVILETNVIVVMMFEKMKIFVNIQTIFYHLLTLPLPNVFLEMCHGFDHALFTSFQMKWVFKLL